MRHPRRVIRKTIFTDSFSLLLSSLFWMTIIDTGHQCITTLPLKGLFMNDIITEGGREGKRLQRYIREGANAQFT